jgi:hypothetical protein
MRIVRLMVGVVLLTSKVKSKPSEAVRDDRHGREGDYEMNYLAVGNGEPCPFCGKILDSRPEMKGEDIQKHLFRFHEKELLDKLFPKGKELK